MKKLFALALALLLCASCLTVTAEEEAVLNLFTWESYIDDVTLANFTAKTGIKINFTTFNSNEEMLYKLQATGGADYDVVLASDYILNIARKQELLLPLDKTLLPNYGNIDPSFQSQYFDPDNEYTVPYVAGTPLIVYDPNLVDVEITGYESLWNEALRDSIVLIDDARNIIGITLKTMGQSFNVTDEAILAQAKEKLMALRPNIRAFNYDTPHWDLLSGECSVAYMFTPFVVMALAENPELKVVYPEEGMGFGIDSLVIPVKAPHPQNAHQLLDYLCDGEVAAYVAQQQLYMCPIAAAREFMPADMYDNPALYIPADILGATEFIQDVGEEFESMYQSIWTDFKLQ